MGTKVRVFNTGDALTCTTPDGREEDLSIWRRWERITLDNLRSLSFEEACAVVYANHRQPFLFGKHRTISVQKELREATFEVCTRCMHSGRIRTTDNPTWYNEDCPECGGTGQRNRKE